MSSDLSSRYVRSITGLFLAALLAGCGDGRGQQGIPGTPQPTLTGVFVDSPVSGVTWKASGGTSGITNNLGEFQYVQPEAGTYVETVTFSIGDIVLGTAPGIPFKGERLYVTAVELTGSIDPLDAAATNQLVFIQSIDSDEDPTNGITISEATQAAAVGQTLDFNSSDFATEVAEVVAAIAPGNAVVSDTAALDHFYTTYAALGGTDTFDWLFPGYPPVGDGSDVFQLVFADEFDTDGPPNPDVWNIEQGYGNFGWGNNEWQLYTDSPDNLRVEDGNLVITAQCPVKPCGVRDGTVTSGRIQTLDKFDFKYGKVVARIKVPVGQGTWPAFWALGANIDDVGWPRSGEIDFMEVFNNTNNTDSQSAVAERTATSAMHWCDETIVPNPQENCFPAGRRFVSDKLDTGSSLDDDFQIWEADWNADRVIISINGIQYFELEIDPATMEEFRREFFLLLNVAMGGTLGSSGEPPQGDELEEPQTMLVDYVRVYQQVDDISPPELTDVTIASNNANPAFAKTGDTVTVTLTANEAITTPEVTIGDIAATTVTGSGTDWQASRALTGADDDGVIEFTVDYADLAGNDGVQASESTDGSRVTVDTIAPALNTVTIASDNVDPGLATTGDTVTVTLNANEAIAPPVVSIGGTAATPVGSGANWSASRMLTAGETQGVIAFSIDYADFAGNAGAPVSTTTDSSSVTVDTVAPTVTIDGAPPSFANQTPINLEFNFSEPVIGFELADIDVTNGSASNLTGDGAAYTADVTPVGIGNLTVGVPAGAAMDAAGNSSMAAVDVEILNLIPVGTPVLNPVSIASDNLTDPAYASADNLVTLSFTADRNVNVTSVKIDGKDADSVTGGPLTFTATRTMLPGDTEGDIAFVIQVQNAADGTPGSISATTDGSTVTFDVTAPTPSIEGLPAEIDFLEPITVTFDFGEPVIGFELEDILVTNGSKEGFTIVDEAVYTAEITPNGANAGADLNVTVLADSATDRAGNGNEEDSVDTPVGSAWESIGSDDFDAGLDAGLWTVRTNADCPDPCPNDGVQEYQAQQVSTTPDDGGRLMIQAVDDGFGAYTSGILDTRGKFEFKYGRVEIDAIMPGTQGTLPSLRLLPAEPTVYGAWPQSGEIEIVNVTPEGLAANQTLNHTLRYGLPKTEDTATTATSVAPGIPTLDLIEYAIEWEGGEIRWFVDDVHVATQIQNNWYAYYEDDDGVYTLSSDPMAGPPAAPFDQDFYVVIGLAIGDDPGTNFPQELQVDAVRFYQCVNPADAELKTGCGTFDPLVIPEDAPGQPYVDAIEVYADSPLNPLPFENPEGGTIDGTLVDATFESAAGVVVNSVLGSVDPVDAANDAWNVTITAAAGTGGASIVPPAFDGFDGYFDLTGGDVAGELKFSMYVEVGATVTNVEVGLDDGAGAKSLQAVDFAAADGQWHRYSVKIADLSSLDIADIVTAFVLEASGGSVNLYLDDIELKVACEDADSPAERCLTTPKLKSGAPATPYPVYAQDFESLDINNPDSLGLNPFLPGAQFKVFGDVWDGPVDDGAPQYSYGPFSAPNGGPAFSAIATGEGGIAQGAQYLNIYSDYDNGDHGGGSTDCPEPCTINTAVFREATIPAACIGSFFRLTGQFKSVAACGIAEEFTCNTGNPNTSEASAFIKTIDPNAGYTATNDIRFPTTDAEPDVWQEFEVTIDLSDPLLEGQLLQFGFGTEATLYNDSGVFYDNLQLSSSDENAACQGIFD